MVGVGHILFLLVAFGVPTILHRAPYTPGGRRLLGGPGEHPWRVGLLALVLTGVAVAMVDHFAGEPIGASHAWGAAVAFGVVCGVIAALLIRFVWWRRAK